MNSNIEEILYSQDQIVKKCAELGKQISIDYKDKTPIFIGVLKGCVPFMAELIKHIDCDMQIEFMDVSSYEGTESTGQIKILKDVGCSVKNRHIILVEDIIDTGLTLKEVEKILKLRSPLSVEVVALLDKPEGRTFKAINAKYVGFEIPKKFVVGFGLDYNELYRNLPYVGVLKRCVYEK